MNIVIVGHKSEIARRFEDQINAHIHPQDRGRIYRVGRGDQAVDWTDFKEWSGTRWLFCNGRLDPKTVGEMNPAEFYGHTEDNMGVTIRGVEQALKYDDAARVCVIGSTSADRGSHNMLYAAAKAGLHGYVRGRRLLPRQQLVCVAPGIVADAGMTTRRVDQEYVASREHTSMRGRFVTSIEVAQLCFSLLFEQSVMVSNCVIPIGDDRL